MMFSHKTKKMVFCVLVFFPFNCYFDGKLNSLFLKFVVFFGVNGWRTVIKEVLECVRMFAWLLRRKI